MTSRSKKRLKKIAITVIAGIGFLVWLSANQVGKAVAKKHYEQKNSPQGIVQEIVKGGKEMLPFSASHGTVYDIAGDDLTVVYYNRLVTDIESEEKLQQLRAAIFEGSVSKYSAGQHTPGIMAKGIRYKQVFYQPNGKFAFSFEIGSEDLKAPNPTNQSQKDP